MGAVKIPLVGTDRCALVDPEDAERVRSFRWYWHNRDERHGGYAVSHNQSPVVRMHRLVMDAPDDVEVDHINGSGLDNRRSNLRLVTRAEQVRNQRAVRRRVDCSGVHSRYKGVRWADDRNRWRVRITVDGKRITVGQYTNEADAAKAYDAAARKHFGRFARLNFPRPGEQPALAEAA